MFLLLEVHFVSDESGVCEFESFVDELKQLARPHDYQVVILFKEESSFVFVILDFLYKVIADYRGPIHK